MRMYALYTNSGAPVTGLTLAQVVFTVKAIKRSDSSVTTPVTAQAATVDVGGGYYLYDYAAADFETYDYVWFAQYTGATSVDAAYVFGNTDAVAGVDDLSGFSTAGKAEVQAEVEDALVAHGGVGVALVGEAQTWSAQGEAAAALTAYAMGLGVAISGEAAAALAAWVLAYGPAKEATLTTMTGYILRVLGLVQENTIMDTTTFDADDHMLTARIRTFTDATLITVLATYNLTATYDVDGNLATFRVVKA
jgi:hypothetical protein